MLIFDQLKKNDPQLRLLALVLLGGLFVLLAGLWWVQVVSTKDYQTHLETQSFRTVRIPAVRGKILDRNGQVLAESRPSYSISLYLEDLSNLFRKEYKQLRPVTTIPAPFWKAWLGFNSVETQYVRLKEEQVQALTWQARYAVASNVVRQLATRLQQPLALDFTNFCRHYQERLALPYPVLNNLDPAQIARFEEQFSGALGADLAMQPTRVYPHGTTAAHVLGYVQRDDSSKEGEDAYDFNYYLPDYRGQVGVEAGFDAQLRGRPGAKSVLVNNLGYRQTENVWDAVEPGRNVVLTIDLRIQQAAERALQRNGTNTRGAAVVMDPRNGDILAMVSSPAFDPNVYARRFTSAESAWLNDPKLLPQHNRAVQDNYSPGSIFKIVISLACLEAGLDPKATIYNPGLIYIGRRPIHDLAPPGAYDFRRALLKSCNTYFITNGLRAGIENIIQLGQRLHLGERSGIPTLQETPGNLPTLDRVRHGWTAGDTANVCIGQGELDVTPVQMAVTAAAIANGGTVFYPRLAANLELQDPASGETPTVFSPGRVRDELGVTPRTLDILREAMLADTEDREGTAYDAFHERDRVTPSIQGLRVCGKTGTAQIKNARGEKIGDTLWFISFAPYDRRENEKPRYAVVVMVESDGGGSGGLTCAPVARDIYAAIQKIDGTGGAKALAQGK